MSREKEDLDNYRPISVIPRLARVSERLKFMITVQTTIY